MSVSQTALRQKPHKNLICSAWQCRHLRLYTNALEKKRSWGRYSFPMIFATKKPHQKSMEKKEKKNDPRNPSSPGNHPSMGFSHSSLSKHPNEKTSPLPGTLLATGALFFSRLMILLLPACSKNQKKHTPGLPKKRAIRQGLKSSC